MLKTIVANIDDFLIEKLVFFKILKILACSLLGPFGPSPGSGLRPSLAGSAGRPAERQKNREKKRERERERAGCQVDAPPLRASGGCEGDADGEDIQGPH